MGKEVMEFVKHLPHETYLHYVLDAAETLKYWAQEIPYELPDDINAELFFQGARTAQSGI